MNFIVFIRNFPFVIKLVRIVQTFFCIIMNFLIKIIYKNIIPRYEEVLIIRPDGIGDFIIWLDAAKEFRNLYKGRRITLLCNPACVELANKLQYFDYVIPFNINKFRFNIFYRFSLLKMIRKHGYYTVVRVRWLRDFTCDDSIVDISGAVERIGFEGDLSNINDWRTKISNRYHTTLIKLPDRQRTTLEFNIEFMQALGLKEFEFSLPMLPDDILPEISWGIETKYYILFPGASLNYRKWPLEKFSAIASRVYENTGWTGYVCGGDSNEFFLGENLVQITKNIPLINIAGKTSLLELIKIIKDAIIVITNETSAVHIAAAVSTPSVCILGGGHYGLYLPIPPYIQGIAKPQCVTYKMDCFNCNWFCIYNTKVNEPYPCIKNVSIEDVWEKVDLIINS